MIAVPIILFSMLILFGLNYFWENRYEYFFKGEQPFELKQETKKHNTKIKPDQKDSSGQGFDQEMDEELDKQDEKNRPVQEYEVPEIEKADCENRCDDFEDKDLEYCKEICGLSEREIEAKQKQEEEADDVCVNKVGLERDTCYKWRAIEEKNIKLCDEISNDELAENCENRVIEELIP